MSVYLFLILNRGSAFIFTVDAANGFLLKGLRCKLLINDWLCIQQGCFLAKLERDDALSSVAGIWLWKRCLQLILTSSWQFQIYVGRIVHQVFAVVRFMCCKFVPFNHKYVYQILLAADVFIWWGLRGDWISDDQRVKFVEMGLVRRATTSQWVVALYPKTPIAYYIIFFFIYWTQCSPPPPFSLGNHASVNLCALQRTDILLTALVSFFKVLFNPKLKTRSQLVSGQYRSIKHISQLIQYRETQGQQKKAHQRLHTINSFSGKSNVLGNVNIQLRPTNKIESNECEAW